mmetsp:Transcript_395/g.1348  ORF Transcript_395/g.1348 Transcript_395/m.1348 type:complete len:130 (+) Transcript_395:1668-2057(+)
MPAPRPLHVHRSEKCGRKPLLAQVSFQVAKKDDIWFHAAGLPGSHVVLHVGGEDAVGEQDLQFAADFAAYFSRGRKQTAQSVIYTRARNIRRAGPAGLVTFRNEKFIDARPDRVADAASALLLEAVSTG